MSDYIFENISLSDIQHDSLINDDVEDFLSHHGTKGMHWGVRQYQNSDGSLTPMGRIRYGVGAARKSAHAAAASAANKLRRKIRPTLDEVNEDLAAAQAKKAEKQAIIDAKKELRDTQEAIKQMDEDEKRIKKEKRQEEIDEKARERFEEGKKVDIRKISDAELNRQMDRLNAEKRYSDMMKQLNPDPEERNSKKTNTFKRQVWDAVKKSGSEAIGNIAKSAIAKAGERALQTEAEKAREDRQLYEDRLKAREAADKIINFNKESKYDKLKQEADMARYAMEVKKHKLELQAYSGVEEAVVNLKRVKDATKK